MKPTASVTITNEKEQQNCATQDVAERKKLRKQHPSTKTTTKNISQAKYDAIENAVKLMRRKQLPLLKENEVLKKAALDDIKPNNLLKAISPDSLCEFLPVYHGGHDFENWIATVKGIKSKYDVDDKTMGSLLCTKLKSRAQAWLYSRSELASQGMQILLAHMKAIFGTEDCIVVRYKKFELRKWQRDEKFADYWNEKIILANRIWPLTECEIIEFIIDGIPNEQLRQDVSAHHFTTTEEVVQYFVSREELEPKFAELKFEYPSNTVVADNGECLRDARCDKCKCKLMHPNMGADVQLKNTKRVYSISFLEGQTKSKPLDLQCCLAFYPLNYIQKSYVPADVRMHKYTGPKLVAVNGVKLEILGKVTCFIDPKFDNIKTEMLVVPDKTLRDPVILGSNFLKESKIKVTFKDAVIEMEEIKAAKEKQKNEENYEIPTCIKCLAILAASLLTALILIFLTDYYFSTKRYRF